jgi:hypothetical protein
MERSTLSPLVPLLWLLSINLAAFGVMQGIFKAGVWFGVLCACASLGVVMYRSTMLGRRS